MEEEKLEVGSALERFNQGSAKYLLDILKDRIRLKILIDKSVGTKHEEAKDIWVSRLGTYIEEGLKCYSNNNPMLSHILANNYVEGIMEISRHYQN